MDRLVMPSLAAAVVALLVLLAYQGMERKPAAPKFATPYQAVLLVNGNAFFGRIENVGSEFPVLRDVFYVRSQVNQETKEVRNTLIKRGSELHAPDAMTINSRHILLIEPVKPDSQLAKLIDEATKK